MTLNPTQPGLASGQCSGWRQGYSGRSAMLAVAPHAGLVALALERIRLIALPGPFRSAGATPPAPARLAHFDTDKLGGCLHFAAIGARAHQGLPLFRSAYRRPGWAFSHARRARHTLQRPW